VLLLLPASSVRAVAQGICILAGIAIGMPFPLNAIQILYVKCVAFRKGS
jgi:hypothetical protein